ncbi:hypothetical protein DMC30DRAFT_259546 [Rhodotorula diobovata]|uniref:Uncharacterized protein n=1 Tax=Rhodotorula diobovata TaxID=5288 RepID=A0A5C5G682_9BASI|nr:hypothetical protein DMC30DRAFT_259546 [Rhodotorula diobovata]
MSNTTGSSSQNAGAEAGQRGKLPPSSSSTSSSTPTTTAADAPPPPPRHPPVTPYAAPDPSTTVPSSHGAPAASAGAALGTRVRGVFEAVHGAGEALRGNINSALDGLGDGVANRPQGTVESRQLAAGEESVAQKGLNELQGGISAAKGETTATPHRTT